MNRTRAEAASTQAVSPALISGTRKPPICEQLGATYPPEEPTLEGSVAVPDCRKRVSLLPACKQDLVGMCEDFGDTLLMWGRAEVGSSPRLPRMGAVHRLARGVASKPSPSTSWAVHRPGVCRGEAHAPVSDRRQSDPDWSAPRVGGTDPEHC